MSCDIVLVGVGGQGILTIGDLLLRAAFEADVPASSCPTKGMAQRGGFVKVEIRLGQEGVGPRIREHGADLVVGMERSEALKGIRYVNPRGTFILFDCVWKPTGAMLGTDPYPTLEQVAGAIRKTTATSIVLAPVDLPAIDGKPAAANVFLLGALFGVPRLAELLAATTIESVVAARWPRASEANLGAFRAGLGIAQRSTKSEPGSHSQDSEIPAGGGG